MYYTYILRSLKNNRYYIGSCLNMDIRLKRHNDGLVTSTKAYKPWILETYEISPTRSEAIKKERLLKSWKSRSKIEEYLAKRNRESSVNCGGPLA
ncbi:MAG: GIY-YIG nuclease family protein [Candidatus Yonathbacteria bacterium]|nr:GIY-YIG nuclease family protein [Candidatus Yonathbacteria bacterium]NTW47956.1 GIY-YIG nuclease family protein [Candidatus Yonathbacteria bacterium]